MKINPKNVATKFLFTFLITTIVSTVPKEVYGQQNPVKPVLAYELNTIIDSISKIVPRYYIKPEIANQIVTHIRNKNKEGHYATITNPQILSDSLSQDLRAINGDLHMNMIYRSPRELTTSDSPPIQVNKTGIWTNYGLNEMKVLDGNIGYLKIKHFTQHQHLDSIRPVVTNAIEFLKNTDAIIIDVRNNGGGFEDMVAYYISYFFDTKEPIHLSDYRCTLHNHTYGISTDPNITGTKLPNTQLYILVNANTGSAAESFAYMLKHLDRATIIGETTAGAGNGASHHEINDRFTIQVSSEETINAITKTSFEKTGVIPHISATSIEAFSKAYKLALEYAKKNNKRKIHPSNYDHLISFISTPKSNKTIDTSVYSKYLGIYKAGNIHITITMENNLLYGQMKSKGGKMELTLLENHTFKVGDIKERIRFVLDKNENVIQLIGIDSPMKLIKVSK
ncbi:S41 family peptidase [Aquimarina sp. 2201CG14-23]|uniref:S41 family peptidase n=1 Tax=Aquimarina mycalae TaxID=3040073 RepID=UPI002477FE8E|nr:S41 family peptidase [Aquimarina sp. 2201CG14-23]MDH7447041.1 S41 family peptidase [Aquimarina sp. 2201CG14-23]